MIPHMHADYRAASLMRDRFVTAQPELAKLDDVKAATEQCERWYRMISKATQRHWHHAAQDLTFKLVAALQALQGRTRSMLSELQPRLEISPGISAGDIFHDLSEFKSVSMDLKRHRLIVRTDEITLEDICLGPFDIELDWSFDYKAFHYDITAVEPNAATSNSEATHPHVQHETLCEGDGATAIERALNEGRLFDFFCIVDRILKTYNAGNAYVELSDWRGVECSDCGQTADAHDVGSCEKCDCNLCDCCARCCNGCGETRCSNCIWTCGDCAEDYCGSCFQSCTNCCSDFCSNCLTEGKCNDCLEQEKTSESDEDSEFQEPEELGLATSGS